MNALKDYDIDVLNESGETIPGFAVMQVSGWEPGRAGRDYVKVTKPDGEGTVFLLNSPFPIANDKPGRATDKSFCYALYDIAETPAVDESWGPKADEWHLVKDNEGFFVVGDEKGAGANARVRVALSPGGGSGVLIGQTTATVADTDATFTIDNIFSVDGTDPRTDPESSSETLEVKNSLGLELEDDQKVFAYKNKAGDWETWADTGGDEGGASEFHMTVKGVLGATEGDAITSSTSSFTLSSLQLVNGTEVPGSLTVTNNPPLHAPPGATIYARYNLLVGSGDTNHWDTASSKNFLYMVKGIGDYNASAFQIPIQDANDNPDWQTFTGKSGSADHQQALGQEAGSYKFIPICTIATATAGGTVAATDSTFSATITDIKQGRSVSGSVTVNNTFGFAIDSGDPCEIKLAWDGDDADDWYCSQAKCPD